MQLKQEAVEVSPETMGWQTLSASFCLKWVNFTSFWRLNSSNFIFLKLIQINQEVAYEPVVTRRIHCILKKVWFKEKFWSCFAGTLYSTPVAVEQVKKENMSQRVPSVLFALNDENALWVLHYEEDLEYR